MHGGHYTAYVRVRKEVELVKVKLRGDVPTVSGYGSDITVCSSQSALNEDESENKENDQIQTVDNPISFDYSSTENSQWYYISDSHVVKASCDDVLQCQAYLLFYERLPFC